MSSVVELRSRPWPRVLAVAAIAIGAAACSDAARFDSNPYASQDTTGSIQQQQRAPTVQVQTSSLPPPSGYEPATVPASGVSGGGRGMASFQPARTPDPITTGSVQSPHALPPPIRQSKAPGGKIAPT